MEVGLHTVLRWLELEIVYCGAVCVHNSQHYKFLVQVLVILDMMPYG
jgi:hypothetical protein